MIVAPSISTTADDVARFLEAASSKHVSVIGDVMLDEYIGGSVSRVSPEAPVPVVRAQKTFHRLGGGANVAHGVVALGGRSSVHGMIGLDEAGRILRTACTDAGIGTESLVVDERGPTTRKVRFLAQQQQMLRVDWETVRSPTAEQVTGAILSLDGLRSTSAIVLSDYAKGFVSHDLLTWCLHAARARSMPLLVDSKNPDLRQYDGATVITPNLKELEAATGRSLHDLDDEAIADATHAVLRDRQIAAILVTMGERGMMLVPRDGDAYVIRATAREVFDVTGAGDTVIAVMALGLAAGLTLKDAAGIANLAAGIIVGKLGTSTATPAELLALFPASPASSLLTRSEVARVAAAWRAEGKRVVFTNGCFDLLHIGHVEMLRCAAAFGDKLVVGVNSDASVRKIKGPTRPIVCEGDRAHLLAELGCVAAVSIFDEETPAALIQAVRPHVLVKGGDYAATEILGAKFVESIGGEVKSVPLVANRSTARLVGLMREGISG